MNESNLTGIGTAILILFILVLILQAVTLYAITDLRSNSQVTVKVTNPNENFTFNYPNLSCVREYALQPIFLNKSDKNGKLAD